MRLTNKKNIIKFQYSIQGNNIQEVHQVKYLGVTINNNLSWSAHTKIISSKANSVLGFFVVTLTGALLKQRVLCIYL